MLASIFAAIIYFIILSIIAGFIQGIKLILATIISYILCIIIHELGHVFTGKLLGISANIIYLGPFTFIRENNKWAAKFKIQSNDMFLGSEGGLKFPQITSEEDLKKTAKKLRKYYIAGPIVNLVIGVIIFLIFVKIYASNISVYLFIFSILSIWIGMMAIITEDGSNFKKIKKSDSAAALILFINVMLYDGLKNKEAYSYLLMKVKENAENITGMDLMHEKIFEQIYYNYIVLYYYLGDIIYLIPENVRRSIDFFEKQKKNFIKFRYMQNLFEDFLHLIIIYKTIYEGKKEEAKKIYAFIQTNFKNDSRQLNYSRLRSQYFLDISDNYDFLTNKDNMSAIYQGDSFYEIEMNILKLK